MNLIRLYRMSLRLLPAELRRKHGQSMERLFARDVAQARQHGRLSELSAATNGVWDVVTRGAYEHVRPSYGANTERSHMEGTQMDAAFVPPPSTAQLLRRLAVSFAIALVGLTGMMLATYASRQIPALTARGAEGDAILQALLLAVPFTVAMTIPMATLVAVLHVFTRLGADGVLSGARRVRHGTRRLVIPVLTASAVVATLALAVTTQVLPGANTRLSAVMRGGDPVHNDRTMTVGELQAAAQDAKARGDGDVAVAGIQVEIHKKFALPAACVVLALVGMAVAFRFARGGVWTVMGASLLVFSAYYTMLMAGETLADQLLVPPFVAMWGANVLLLVLALLLMRTAGTMRGAASPRIAGA